MRLTARRFAAVFVCLAAASAFSQDQAPTAPATPAAPAAQAAGEKVKLEIRMEKGARVWMKQATTVEQEMEIGGMPMSTQIEMNQIWSQACESVDEKGVMSVRGRYGRSWGKMANPMMGEVTFDSDDPNAGTDNPMLAQALSSMTAIAGKEFTQKLAPDGKFSDIKLADGFAGGAAEEAVVKQAIQGMAGIAMLPANPVAVGESWDVSNTVNSGGIPLTVKMKNTVKKIEAERVTVSISGSVTMGVPEDGGSGGNPMAAMIEKMTLSDSSISGTSVYSRKDGMPDSVDMDQALTLKLEDSAETPGGMAIKMKTKVKLARIDEPAAPKKTETPAAPTTPSPAAPAGPGAGDK